MLADTLQDVTQVHDLIDLEVLRQPVGDKEHRCLAAQRVDGGGEVLGGLGVEAACGFIEDEALRLLEQGTGDGDADLATFGLPNADCVS